VEDVRWLCRYLGRITDAQIRAALDASGASPDERDRFARALHRRIDQLRAVTLHRLGRPPALTRAEDRTANGRTRSEDFAPSRPMTPAPGVMRSTRSS
jgi:hypothetical protein